MLVPRVERARAVGGLEDAVALAQEDPAGEAAHGLLVLHHEDRLADRGAVGAVLRAGSAAARLSVGAGSSTSIVVPAPGADWISTVPPVWVTIPYTVARPRPVPSPFGLVV